MGLCLHPLSLNKTAAASNCAVLNLIYRAVHSSIREDTVVANATTKKVNEQDTKNILCLFVASILLLGVAFGSH